MAHSHSGSNRTSRKPLLPARTRRFSLSSATPGSTSRPTRDGHTYRSPSRQRDIVLSSHRHLSRRTRTRTLSAHGIGTARSEEHKSELQSLASLVYRLLLEKERTPPEL